MNSFGFSIKLNRSSEVGLLLRNSQTNLWCASAGKPDAPANCTLTRRLRTTIKLVCIAGSNGGFDQAFHLQVAQEGKSLINVTRDKPVFKVSSCLAVFEHVLFWPKPRLWKFASASITVREDVITGFGPTQFQQGFDGLLSSPDNYFSLNVSFRFLPRFLTIQVLSFFFSGLLTN